MNTSKKKILQVQECRFLGVLHRVDRHWALGMNAILLKILILK